MRPSKIASLRLQACGTKVSPLPGTRMIAAVIGSSTPRRCASWIGTRSGSGLFGGSAMYSFTVPDASCIRTSSYFWVVAMLDE